MYSKELAGGKKFLIQIELKSKELAPKLSPFTDADQCGSQRVKQLAL